MITAIAIHGMLKIVEFCIGLIPEGFRPPGWVSGLANASHNLLSSALILDTWVPIDLAFTVALTVIHCYIGGIFVKGARILISHFTGGGGSAN